MRRPCLTAATAVAAAALFAGAGSASAAPPAGSKILLLYSDCTAEADCTLEGTDPSLVPDDLISHLRLAAPGSTVDAMDGHLETPTAATFAAYDEVITFQGRAYKAGSPGPIGDALASYVDGGGLVVQYAFDNSDQIIPFGSNWQTDYSPFQGLPAGRPNPGEYFDSSQANTNPLMAGVTYSRSEYRTVVPDSGIASGATLVARWSTDCLPFVAVRNHGTGRVVSITAHPSQFSGWAGIVGLATNALSSRAASVTQAAPVCVIPPTGLTATANGPTTAELSWTASTDPNVTDYDIYQDGVKVRTTATTNESITGLTSGQTYKFTVRALDAGRHSSIATEEQGVTMPADGAPTAPGLSLGTVTSTTVSLNWTASQDDVGVTGYDVYRDGIKVAGVSGSTTSYVAAGLSPGTPYSFTVRARDAAGHVVTSNTVDTVTATVTPGRGSSGTPPASGPPAAAPAPAPVPAPVPAPAPPNTAESSAPPATEPSTKLELTLGSWGLTRRGTIVGRVRISDPARLVVQGRLTWKRGHASLRRYLRKRTRAARTLHVKMRMSRKLRRQVLAAERQGQTVKLRLKFMVTTPDRAKHVFKRVVRID